MAEPYQPQDALSLWWLEDPRAPVRIGTLSLVLSGRGVALQYDGSWLENGFALSEDLPLAAGLFMPRGRDQAAGAVDDARPDRWGERVIRKFEPSPRLSVLEFLLFAGDDRYGALGVSQSADRYEPWPSTPMPAFEQMDGIAEVVRKVLANEPVTELERRLVRPGASLGGARPKSLVRIDGQPWIVKFPEGEDIDMPLVEHAAMTLARACGVDAAATRPVPAGSGNAVAIQRFDRRGSQRLHAISANVALGAAGEELGYPHLSQLLRRLAPAARIAAQQAQLFRRMVFNILVDNTDDHEKNHALLRDDGGAWTLAPAFDIVPAAQGLGYQQMIVGDGGTDSSLGNAMTQCAQFGLKKDAAASIVAEVARGVDGWQAHFRSAGVADDDVQLLGQYIDGSRLKPQRTEFLR